MSEVFVLSFEHLRGFPRENEALALLKKIASLVKPIMRKHGWRLPTLGEFFPEQGNLLGLNVDMGQKILIRLRPAFDRGAFMQEHDLLGTMLHELTHNVHGPHDQNFYKFLAGLEDELEALQRSGYAGEGFFAPGRRLGGNGGFARNIPPQVARLRNLQVAEQRRRQSLLLNGGGRLGGGDLASLGLSMRELTALAADMRAEDAKRCATGDKSREDDEVEKAKRDSIRTAGFELPVDDDEIIVTEGPYIRQPSMLSSNASSSAAQNLQGVRPTPPPINMGTRPPTSPLSWRCSFCTFVNAGELPYCEICEQPRCGVQVPRYAPPSGPPPTKSASKSDTRATALSLKNQGKELPPWDCFVCGEKGHPHELWTCRFCGSVKLSSSVPV